MPVSFCTVVVPDCTNCWFAVPAHATLESVLVAAPFTATDNAAVIVTSMLSTAGLAARAPCVMHASAAPRSSAPFSFVFILLSPCVIGRPLERRHDHLHVLLV